MAFKKMWLNINGVNRMFICDPNADSLADVLRRMGCTGVKIGCGIGVCGSCSVILNGELIRSCNRKISRVDEYSSVITVEGIGTPNNLHPIQTAFMNNGAIQCGFCTPGFVVSTYALLLKNNHPTRIEVKEWFHKHKNVCRCTGYKQIVNAVMDAAKILRGEAAAGDITFNPPSDGEYYGKPVVRPTALAKVTGMSDYGDDQALKMPHNTWHIAVVQPKLAHHAKILSIDISEAEKMPGVAKVILAADLKAVGGTNVMAEANWHERSTVTQPSRKVLCEDRIFRYGDVVGLVAADTKAHARAAAAKVKVEIEKLPEYLNFLEAAMPDAMRIHEDTPNVFCMQPVLKGAGLEEPSKVAEIIDNSKYRAEGSFYSAREPHLSIEGCVAQAYFDEDGFLTMHCKSHGLYSSLSRVGNSLGVPKDKLRVLMNPTGGAFGWSTNAGDICLAGAAAVVMKAPISLSMSYEEHQHFSGKRCPCHSNGRIACDENGMITAVEFETGLDHGAYSWGGDDCMTKQARFAFFPYYVPNAAGLCRVANTNHNFGTAYRSYGSPQAYTLSEALIDMAAEEAGIDPFEFRWRNIARDGQTNINSYPFRQYPMEEMMKIMKPLYEEAVARAKAADTPERRRGVGLAWGGFNVSEGSTDSAEVAIEINPDGTFTKYDTYQELGQGGDIGSLMLTLEALKPLGVTPDKIRLVQNDTKICPNSGMSAASRGHYMTGHATVLAAEQLIAAMRKPDGTYRTHGEMKTEGIPTKYFGKYSNMSVPGLCRLDPNTGIGDPTPAYTYCLNMAEVEVDTATGKVRALGFTCVDDVGKVGNIQAVDGQAYGGISHSIGFALSENYDDVKRHTNIASSGVPYAMDTPDDITVIHYERPDELGPFGSSGASEAFQSSGHVAVLNAIYNACGVRVYEMPATPAKIKAGLDAIASGGKPYKPSKYFLGSELYEELENIKANPVKTDVTEEYFVGLGGSITDTFI
ncbi:MAG: molybdopterin-dependent oxidoreductase [Synergistaceae bacterium]|jgi:aldehyde oxidoreductase|nr:molybdopterin-dependent oxidoreductase [Synergistaceae bacterium]